MNWGKAKGAKRHRSLNEGMGIPTHTELFKEIPNKHGIRGMVGWIRTKNSRDSNIMYPRQGSRNIYWI